MESRESALDSEIAGIYTGDVYYMCWSPCYIRGPIMQRFVSLLLQVWREACQHTQIGDSAPRLALLLAKHSPIDFLLVRRIDLERSSLETVGVGSCASRPATLAGRTPLKAEDLEHLLAWCRRGQVLHLPGRI